MMLDRSRRLILLGPQPEYRSLSEGVERLNLEGPVAVVTAGWEEAELDKRRLDPLMDALPSGSENLELFRRSEDLFHRDPPIIDLLRQRQDELRHLRDVYQLRMDHLLEAARELLRRDDPLIDIAIEQESAMEMVRQLDRQYLIRTCQICDRYEEQLNLAARPLVQEHRRELKDSLRRAAAICVGGGHTGIILNRLRIFSLLDLQPDLPVIAWSGGAMALADQIVLFHDRPPQGQGNAEVLRAGMSLFGKILPLPDARRRLQLDDRHRVALFSRRFQEFQCIIFDDRTVLDRQRGKWKFSPRTERLTSSGCPAEVSA